MYVSCLNIILTVAVTAICFHVKFVEILHN